jgi:hypothetical protein
MLSPCSSRRDCKHTQRSKALVQYPILLVATCFLSLSQPAASSLALDGAWGRGSIKTASNVRGAESSQLKFGHLALRGGADVANVSEKAPVMSFAAPATARSDTISQQQSAGFTDRKVKESEVASSFTSMFSSPRKPTSDGAKGVANSTSGILKSSISGPFRSSQEEGPRLGQTTGQAKSTSTASARLPMDRQFAGTSSGLSAEAGLSAPSGMELSLRNSGIEKRFRELMEGCKKLHGTTMDPGLKRKLELRISDLELAEEIMKKIPKHLDPADYTQHDRFNIERVEYQLDAVEYSVGSILPKSGDQACVKVTFVLKCEATEIGDKVLLTGECEELGWWDVHKALQLTTDEDTFPYWSVTVDLKAGEMVAYKFLIGKPSDMQGIYSSVLWEGHMGNRELKVGRNTQKPQVVEDEFIRAEEHCGNIADSMSPGFVHMHSNAFLDPEYVCLE